MKLHKININNLTIPTNRQRREFPPEKIVELASSISQNGLIQPIIIRRGRDDELVLVAGERRIKALLYMWQFGERLRCGVNEETGLANWFEEGELPCLYQGELDPLAAFEMELEENIRRDDLTWQERANATAQLMSLRTEQAAAAGKPAPTTATISEEVRGSGDAWYGQQTHKEIVLAKHMDDPEVAGAKTLDEGYKILKRKEETQKNAELADRVGKTFSAVDHHLLNVECVKWLSECPANSYDVILTDPPYGMGADEFGDSGGKAAGAHSYDDDLMTWRELMLPIGEELFRVAKPQAHVYIFCDIDQFHELRDYIMKPAGWQTFRTPLIWYKPSGFRAPWPDGGPQRKYELILFASKGKKPVTKLAGDVITCNPDDNLGHHAQKPVALFIDLLRRSIRPGDTVLDPFCGSGTIFPACHQLQCRATGIEIDPASYGLAAKRLGELK